MATLNIPSTFLEFKKMFELYPDAKEFTFDQYINGRKIGLSHEIQGHQKPYEACEWTLKKVNRILGECKEYGTGEHIRILEPTIRNIVGNTGLLILQLCGKDPETTRCIKEIDKETLYKEVPNFDILHENIRQIFYVYAPEYKNKELLTPEKK